MERNTAHLSSDESSEGKEERSEDEGAAFIARDKATLFVESKSTILGWAKMNVLKRSPGLSEQWQWVGHVKKIYARH